MGHQLQAVIGPAEGVARFAEPWHHARVIELPQDFRLIPMTEALYDEITDATTPDNENASDYMSFMLLSPQIAVKLARASAHGAIGYIETDLHGGTGTQAAMAWKDNAILTEPLSTTFPRRSFWRNPWSVLIPPGETAISQVLRQLGVRSNPLSGRDCFDALGLGQFRSMDDFEPEGA